MTDIKVALVTGAASGMGRISAKRLAADGIRVAAVDVNEDGLNDLKQESNNISIFPHFSNYSFPRIYGRRKSTIKSF